MSEESLTFAEVVARKNRGSQSELVGADDSVASLPSHGALQNGLIVLPSRPSVGESYADAVKSASVKLGGVPVNVSKLDGHESVTNSTLQEQESVLSSWADDDECFFDSVRNALQNRNDEFELRGYPNNSLSYVNVGNNGSNNVYGNSNNNYGGYSNFRRGRGSRGWRFINGNEANSSNGNTHSNNNKKRKGYNNKTWGSYNPPCGVDSLNHFGGGRFSGFR
ncbi:uncharacterized protein TEOVI_000285400 [Trypanosoma equiperdum]|uniref:Uncharacterized protein n=4 Tax=Trypanozoon TaxID=39700 RepID=Q38A52_TRYB2|nr:hypothetical protein, conserved [Trypanosoma brucei gambiense DAL972]XP_823146.1 hypothetical protein, conserved [Trypanosoma brucei brucei TREU927]RHW69484.1 hypothetical protein DPX39_100099400 [Trypanosoma brucei equiperdum]SCU71273.1 hypothetical protein, conserved [Trypanosoma equiperdum]EAN78318.1 hypothetical protein, conserved [Trypanosoma brucei brucei TREU927]CBH16033.1 hypothetical protein, conserved [Trypanosoma brucei gambiense DAL972]|eukprot:XP_011778297.1 hypothetical protein, conserved [Trypanosoma brucei gambiense DAL972]